MATPEFMGFSLTSPAPEKSEPTAKNRVWGFFGDTQQSHRENCHQPKQPRQGNPPSLTKIVSGRTYWPSRDPIGERGGINLYGMVGNNSVTRWDYLGLVGLGAVTQDAALGKCGGFGWVINWGVSGESNAKIGGQILQDVEITKSVQKCDEEESAANTSTTKFSEVWRVLPGTRHVDGLSHSRKDGDESAGNKDLFGAGNQGVCTKGWIEFKGWARYYPNQSSPDWQTGSEQGLPALDLLANPENPAWDKDGSSGLVTHSIKVKWNCCPTKDDVKPTELVEIKIDNDDQTGIFNQKWSDRQKFNEK